jgi:hypothetical protein
LARGFLPASKSSFWASHRSRAACPLGSVATLPK